VRIDRILDGVLEDCGLDQRLAERDLLTAWSELVGDRLAAHVRAVDFREGVLYLDADHGAWRQEVTLLLPQIRQRCGERFGTEAITDIRWIRPGFR
jgi:predicted nucleic acid-binding Zn ribbon protein